MLTRPCSLWGSCSLLSASENLATRALQNTSLANLGSSKTSLVHAIEALKSIPIWSMSYPRAQTLLAEYQTHLQILTQLLQSQEKAHQAHQQLKQAPLSVQQWQKVRQLSQEAIALLSTTPHQSSFFSLAQTQLRQADIYLRVAEQRLEAEQKALALLKSAQVAARRAQVLQDKAQSLGDWNLVVASWQTAVDRAREVDIDTTSFPRSRQQLEAYLFYFVKAQARHKQEAKAENYLKKAKELAIAADECQENQEWALAISQWSKAIAYLQQVSPQTFGYASAQVLATQYLLALNQAKNRLKISEDLDNTCQQKDTICNYEIRANKIEITLTKLYSQKVRQTALIAQAQTDTKTQIDLLNYLTQLENRLQIISNKTLKPLEVYNSDRVLLTRYEPKN